MQAGITDISLSGGGPKGAGHVGTLLALADFNMLPNIQRINGTSVGALIGLLLAVGTSPEDLAQLVREEDFKKLLDDDPKMLGNSGQPIINMLNMYITIQLHDTLVAYSEIDQESPNITSNIKKIKAILTRLTEYQQTGNEAALNFTFADLNFLHRNDPSRFKHFSTNAVFRNTKGKLKSKIFDETKTPNINLVDACRASASLPLVLKPHAIEGEQYQDGGTLENTLWAPSRPATQQLMLVFRDPNSADLLDAWKKKEIDISYANAKAYANTHLKYSFANRAIRNYAAHHAFPQKAIQGDKSMVEVREAGIRKLLEERPDSVLIVDTPGITSSDFNKAKNKAEFLFLYNYFSTARALIEKNMGTTPIPQGDENANAFKQRIELGMFLLKHFQAAGGEQAKTFNQTKRHARNLHKIDE